jgi:phosphomannomutase
MPSDVPRLSLLIETSFLKFASPRSRMKMSLMVSISGIRGIVGQTLTPETIVKYAAAFAEYCEGGTVVIGRDGRVTGKSIAHIVSSTLLQMGCDVIAVGVCPTPTVALAVELKKASGGIAITASHNPMEWNGLKFFASTGLFLDSTENKALWTIADRETRSYAAWNKQGTHAADPGLLDEHIKNVLSLPYIETNKVSGRKFRVVVDCVNAAGSVIVPRLLREFGCDVVEMNCDSSGIFAHTPEPIPENLSELSVRVREERADLGIAVDPDVDRLVLIDEKGEPIGEEYTIASVVKFVLQKERGKRPKSATFGTGSQKVVVNLSTTRAVDDIAKEYGAELIRTPVGEIHVAKKMKEVGAIVGGEGNGGVILPASHIGRDALVGIGLTLQHLAEFGGTLSELKRSLPQYIITKGKVDLGGLNPDGILKRLQEAYIGKGVATTTDGLKLDFTDSWVHLRKSNTEPIIRIIAEASAKRDADNLVATFTKEIMSR